jgi:hypothetical protein
MRKSLCSICVGTSAVFEGISAFAGPELTDIGALMGAIHVLPLTVS